MNEQSRYRAMSTPDPDGREPTHAFTEAAQWFNQWHGYRSIVDNDWMGHRGRSRPMMCARWPAKQSPNSPHVNSPGTPQGFTDFSRSPRALRDE